MNWLLKITEGPMKGAEIALVSGTRVTLGRSDACDIVIADAALPEEAASLDISDAAVTLVLPDGSGTEMRPFETHAFGATEFAIGPAEGVWQTLRPATVPESEAPHAESETTPTDSVSPSDEPAPVAKSSPRRPLVLVCFALVLLAVMGLAYYVCGDRIRARVMAFLEGHGPVTSEQTCKQPTLSEIANEHGLQFVESNDVRTLSGNLARRTERLAIRALALAADRYCRLDVSDDESFAGASEALLFAVTEGAVTVKSASNRAVALTGYAPTQKALDQVEKALWADVPWLRTVSREAVTVGGAAPAHLLRNRFAQTGELATAGSRKADVLHLVQTNAAAVVSAKGKCTGSEASAYAQDLSSLTPEEVQAARLVSAARATGDKLPRSMLPVAGILTKPYACVVLRDGHRIVEGAKISGLEVRRIEATRLTLGFRSDNVYWEP